MRRVLLTVALVVGVVATPAQADKVYRWVDEKGKVHYGDRPAQGAEQLKLRRPGQAVPSAPADESPSEQCLQAQQQLREYQGAERIVERDALGNERQYSPEQHAQLIARTQDKVQELCEGSA